MSNPNSLKERSPLGPIKEPGRPGVTRRRFLAGTTITGVTMVATHFLPPSLRRGSPFSVFSSDIAEAGGHCYECGCRIDWTYSCSVRCSTTDPCDNRIDERWAIYWYRWWGEPDCLDCNSYCGMSGPYTICNSSECPAGCA